MTYEAGYQDGYEDGLKDAAAARQIRTSPIQLHIETDIDDPDSVDWDGALEENLVGLDLVESGPGGYGFVGRIVGYEDYHR